MLVTRGLQLEHLLQRGIHVVCTGEQDITGITLIESAVVLAYSPIQQCATILLPVPETSSAVVAACTPCWTAGPSGACWCVQVVTGTMHMTPNTVAAPLRTALLRYITYLAAIFILEGA